MKGTSWEGGYRVPFIARWPGKIPAGHVSARTGGDDGPVRHRADRRRRAPPRDRVIDGADLLPLLTSDGKEPARSHLRPSRAAAGDGARRPLEAARAAGRTTPRRSSAGRALDRPAAPDGVTILAPYEQYSAGRLSGTARGDAPQAMALFDLGHRPGEQHDVAGTSDVVKRLKAQFDAMVRDFPQAGDDAA